MYAWGVPALPNVPSVLRCALIGSDASNVDVVTRFYIQYGGTAPSPTQCSAFALSIGSDWGGHLSSLADTGFSIKDVTVVDLTTPSSGTGFDTTTHTGSRSGSAMSLQDSMVISYKIGRRYRGGHPRGYWRLGVQGDLTSAQQWSSTFCTNVETNYTAFMTAVLAAGWTGAGTLGQVNVSFYEGFTVVTNPITGRARNVPKVRTTPLVDPVVSTVAQPFVGTQRRRIQFQG